MLAFPSFLDQPAELVAPQLLGCLLIRKIANTEIVCRIVETEAYSQNDPASHSHRGSTPRTAIMFGPSGRLYVYFTYGMHYCCNIVTGPTGEGSAVLIRAAEPIKGNDLMIKNRAGQSGFSVSNGPAKLCQALSITKDLNHHDLQQEPLRLQTDAAIGQADIVQTTRIGISRGQSIPWRFYIGGNPYVSKLATKI